MNATPTALHINAMSNQTISETVPAAKLPDTLPSIISPTTWILIGITAALLGFRIIFGG